MNLANLPQKSHLRNLLSHCSLEHELALTICNDGAFVMECFECPFFRVLDNEEEEAVKETQVPEKASSGLLDNRRAF